MKIELKNVKYAAFASDETSCFEAIVYIDGVKAGAVSNDGHGGCNRYHPTSLGHRLNAHAETLPDVVADFLGDDDGKPFSYRPDADSVISGLFDAWLVERDVKRLTSKSVVFMRDGKLFTLKFKDPRVLKAINAGSAVVAKSIAPKLNGGTMLNAMPLAEAIALYRKCAT